MPNPPREPAESVWRNGAEFPTGGQPPARYKTVTDFVVAAVPAGPLGLGMEWRSEALGLLTPFPYWHRLEDSEWAHIEPEDRLHRGWRPVGSVDHPFVEVDQGILLFVWGDERFVYVQFGDEERQVIHTWYRVPRAVFDVAWRDFITRLGTGGTDGSRRQR